MVSGSLDIISRHQHAKLKVTSKPWRSMPENALGSFVPLRRQAKYVLTCYSVCLSLPENSLGSFVPLRRQAKSWLNLHGGSLVLRSAMMWTGCNERGSLRRSALRSFQGNLVSTAVCW